MTSRVLHITNGDATVQIMQQAGIEGELLPWRDVLHEGPVPAGLSLQEMSKVRSQFIADQHWSKLEDVRQWFAYRDELLTNFSQFDRVVLWFEHDLYDQLQLIQILSWFASQNLEKADIQLISSDSYLGMLSPDEMCALQSHAQPLLYEQVVIATTAWQTFTLSNPLEWQNLLQQDTACLPFLADAIKRLLQEYPNSQTGLSLVQMQVLIALQKESLPAGQLFHVYQQTEERRFMGDTVFWGYLAQMLAGDRPLIKLPEGKELTLPSSPDQLLSLTEQGLKVLHSEEVWPELKTIDRWVGGVHLTQRNLWLWDSHEEKIIQ